MDENRISGPDAIAINVFKREILDIAALNRPVNPAVVAYLLDRIRIMEAPTQNLSALC